MSKDKKDDKYSSPYGAVDNEKTYGYKSFISKFDGPRSSLHYKMKIGEEFNKSFGKGIKCECL